MTDRKGKEYQENELIITYNNILALKMHVCEVKRYWAVRQMVSPLKLTTIYDNLNKALNRQIYDVGPGLFRLQING